MIPKKKNRERTNRDREAELRPGGRPQIVFEPVPGNSSVEQPQGKLLSSAHRGISEEQVSEKADRPKTHEATDSETIARLDFRSNLQTNTEANSQPEESPEIIPFEPNIKEAIRFAIDEPDTVLPATSIRFDYDPGTQRYSYEPLAHEPRTLSEEDLINFSGDPNNVAYDNFNQLDNHADVIELALQEYLEGPQLTDGTELGMRASEEHTHYVPEKIGFRDVGSPEELLRKLEQVGYVCSPFIATQIALLLKTELNSISSVMLEGPSGCGKSYLAKSLAKVTGAELMVLQCYKEMNMENLIEKPSTLGMIKAMAGNGDVKASEAMNFGIITRAFQRSQEKPVILLIDEIDKADWAIDTFFLGPIQDAVIRPESCEPIEANRENLLVMFTKNMERPLNDALLRRVQPISMTYMKPELEGKILSAHCSPQLVSNLVNVANIMRNADEAYKFERPPAPEELLKSGKYITQMLKWHITDYAFIGKNMWYMLAKSERDREIFERMLRMHPDFYDPHIPDGRRASKYQVFAKLGKILLEKIVEDPALNERGKGYEPEAIGLLKVGSPDDLTRKLAEVGYQCLPFVASQMALLLNTPSNRVRALLLEGPSGCGKSFMAKCLAKITGAELMVLQCYSEMNTRHLIESPSEVAIAQSRSGSKGPSKEDLINLGIISRAFLKSQSQPVILLVDEIDKVGDHLDTFFLGPLQDGTIWPESRDPIDANMDNLLVIFTKNMNRTLDQALLRRLHPIRMTYLDSHLERKILSAHCIPQLVSNLVGVADRMRDSNGSYQFDRPPAPEELLTCGHYISKLLEWGNADFSFIGKSIWAIIAKSERDRLVLEYMLRHHPDFEDPLVMDTKNAPLKEIYARLGRWVLRGIVHDPDEERRQKAWENLTYN